MMVHQYQNYPLLVVIQKYISSYYLYHIIYTKIYNKLDKPNMTGFVVIDSSSSFCNSLSWDAAKFEKRVFGDLSYTPRIIVELSLRPSSNKLLNKIKQIK